MAMVNKPSKSYLSLEELGAVVLDLASDASTFSQKTFGSDIERGPTGPIQHLKKEANELLEEPFDRHEYADCFLLLMDAYRRAGGNITDLILAAREKLEINKNRKWGKADKNGIIQHIK